MSGLLVGSVGLGIALGLSAGLSPGPLLALVVAQTLRHGLGHGLRVALAPLATDVPIVIGSLLLVGSLAGSGPLLGLVSIAGALVVAAVARDTWRATLPDASIASGAPDSWRRGVLVNLLSPHPYLFWLAVGAPTLVALAADGPGPALAFLIGFYVCLIGSKALVAWVIARLGIGAGSRGYRLVMRFLAVVLAVFAVALLASGLGRLGLPLVLPLGGAETTHPPGAVG